MSDQEKDPVVHSSLSKPLFISAALLLLSLGWGLYDEVYGTRPWKGYQARFEKVYSRFLKQTLPNEVASEQTIKSQPEYQDLDRQMRAAEKAVIPQVAEIDRRVGEIVPLALALNEPFQEVRGHVGAITYQIEISKSASSKESMRKEIEELQKEVHTVKLPTPDGGTRIAADDLLRHGQTTTGLEKREIHTPAEARRHDEAGHRTARQTR